MSSVPLEGLASHFGMSGVAPNRIYLSLEHLSQPESPGNSTEELI